MNRTYLIPRSVCLFPLHVHCHYADAKRRKREAAERRAKLDEIAEKQRQRERELDERERLRKEAILGKATENLPTKTSNIPGESRPSDLSPGSTSAVAPPAGKYVPPNFRQSESSVQAPPAEPDRRGSGKPDDHVPPSSSNKW